MIKMDLNILLSLLSSITPGLESRWSILILYNYFNGMTTGFWFYFIIVVFLNALVVIPVYLFLEFLHHHLELWSPYKKTFGRFVDNKKKTAEKVQNRMHNIGYIALALFVGIPFTGTGAYTATIIAWILGLSKRKSFISIGIGVLIASFFTLMGALVFFRGMAYFP